MFEPRLWRIVLAFHAARNEIFGFEITLRFFLDGKNDFILESIFLKLFKKLGYYKLKKQPELKNLNRVSPYLTRT